MRKVNLEIAEKVTYEKEVTIEIPDSWTDEDLNNALDQAQQYSESVDDMVSRLRKAGATIKPYDMNYDNVIDMEVECTDYQFLD